MSLAQNAIGSGPNVLLVHGWTGFKEAWADLPQAIADAGMRAVTVDLPGWGESPSPRGQRHDAFGYAAALVPLLRELRPVSVIGHSMGGQVSAVLAARWPELVERLVLISTPAVPAHRGWRRPKTLVHVVGLPVVGRHLARVGVSVMARRRDRIVASYRRSVFDAEGLEGNARWEDLAKRTMTGLQTTPAGRIADSLWRVARTDLRPLLPDIRCPTLVIFGDRDRSVHPANSPTIARLIPDALLVAVERAAHLPFLERPEIVAPAIVEFLK